MGADSETDNSHTEKGNSATGGDTGIATVLPPPSFLMLISSHYNFQLHHHLKADILGTLQTLQQHNLDLTVVSHLLLHIYMYIL